MTQEEKIEYWITSADFDFRTMENLFSTKDYAWSLFVGHLVIEKLLKGLYIKHKGTNLPPTHNLQRLAKLVDINLTREKNISFEKAYLFGSFTKGNPREYSDIDLAIFAKKNGSRILLKPK